MFTLTDVLPASSPRCFFPASVFLTSAIAFFTISPGVSLVLLQEQPPEWAPLFITVGRGRQMCNQLWWEPGKGLAPKTWGSSAQYRFFQSTALSWSIANPRLFFDALLQGEICLWHDFQGYVNIADPAVSTEMWMPLVDMCHSDASAAHVWSCVAAGSQQASSHSPMNQHDLHSDPLCSTLHWLSEQFSIKWINQTWVTRTTSPLHFISYSWNKELEPQAAHSGFPGATQHFVSPSNVSQQYSPGWTCCSTHPVAGHCNSGQLPQGIH